METGQFLGGQPVAAVGAPVWIVVQVVGAHVPLRHRERECSSLHNMFIHWSSGARRAKITVYGARSLGCTSRSLLGTACSHRQQTTSVVSKFLRADGMLLSSLRLADCCGSLEDKEAKPKFALFIDGDDIFYYVFQIAE
ncbi:MAG: hypothetical protein GY820_15835 [Gammaproteobacteria bacterium]|nr:hypothetical protein [Gammaproteobacteria bacterium]